jgi:putative component of toxin-antitoxin plasmid stabilization module
MLIDKKLLNQLLDLATVSVEYMNSKRWVTIDGNHVLLEKQHNTVKTVIDKLQQKYSKKIKEIKETDKKGYSAYFSSDNIFHVNPEFLKNPSKVTEINEQWQKGLKNELAKYEINKILYEKTGNLKDVEKFGKQIDKIKKDLKFSRYNVIYKEKEIETVLTHEYGHFLSMNLLDRSSDEYNHEKALLIKNTYKEAKKKDDVYKISKYATENIDEFFADTFTIYEMGQEKLPNYLEDMVKKVIN